MTDTKATLDSSELIILCSVYFDSIMGTAINKILLPADWLSLNVPG